MTPWTDLFLAVPLPQSWQNALLFVAFGLHLLFVLLMLGTALLGLFFFLQQQLNGDTSSRLWDGKVVRAHLGLKSLAVVLGVAPLLLIQVRYSHAFFTATGLFSYAWLAVIPLLIVAFLLIDVMAHEIETRVWPTLLCGVVGVAALLTVPAIFTGVLSLMERQEIWPGFAAQGFNPPHEYALNWLLRYLHVVGAALAFGAAFHLFFSTRKNPGKAPLLRKWLFGAMLAQVVIGVPLLFSAAPDLNWPVLMAVTAGAAAAMLALWAMRSAVITGAAPTDAMGDAAENTAENAGRDAAGPRSLLVLLPAILVAMLVARQFIQDQSVAPGQALADQARRERSAQLAPYSQQALESFKIKLSTVYDNGDTIYDGACQPCHGGMGQGDGPAAGSLVVPAEDLAAIRADRGYIYAILLNGTPGSAMPYFRLYDRNKLESLLDTLSARFAMFEANPEPAHAADPAAEKVWAETCAVCHGPRGEISEFGHTLLPAPPDLRAFSLTPERALTVIGNGYPGTAMQPYRSLPEDVRHGLADIIVRFRAKS